MNGTNNSLDLGEFGNNSSMMFMTSPNYYGNGLNLTQQPSMIMQSPVNIPQQTPKYFEQTPVVAEIVPKKEGKENKNEFEVPESPMVQTAAGYKNSSKYTNNHFFNKPVNTPKQNIGESPKLNGEQKGLLKTDVVPTVSMYTSPINQSQEQPQNSPLGHNSSFSSISNSTAPKLYTETPKLQNIVSTANLCCELDLHNIAVQAQNAEYSPKRFAAVILRIKSPKTTALIFKTGKMVCTGAKSVEDSREASRRYAQTIKKLGFDVKFRDFKVQNIVGSCGVGFQIDLTQLKMLIQGFSGNNQFKDRDSSGKERIKSICFYNPEMFPGLIYHMSEPKIVLLIFSSGKIVLTGAKDKSEILKAYDTMFPLLKLCQNKVKQMIIKENSSTTNSKSQNNYHQGFTNNNKSSNSTYNSTEEESNH